MADERPVTREEYEILVRRVEIVESALARAAGRLDPIPSPTPPPRVVAPPPPLPEPIPYAPPPPPRPARAPKMSAEDVLGQRFAPRVGAVLVFLATLFFLGVAIQRGWIGPVLQLLIAALSGAALVGIAAFLTNRKGYGQYPQILEGLGACVMYATAFVAYSLPYYQRATNLTELGGGLLMALVAAGTVGLAVWRDSRVIAGLGYVLSFLTAGIGWGVLPNITLPYVAILGASLAALVAWKDWREVGFVGTLVTGAFFFVFTIDSYRPPPNAWSVVFAAALPAAAFLWLTLRQHEAAKNEPPYAAGVVVVTLAWAAFASVAPVLRESSAIGVVLFAWVPAAVALAIFAHERMVRVAYGASAVILYILATPFFFADAKDSAFFNTATYAAGALALVIAARLYPRAERGLWQGGLALAGASALRAVILDERLQISFDGAWATGSWQSFATFLLLVPALALLFASAPKGADGVSRLVFVAGIVFLGAWGFALFQTPFLVTLYIAAVGAVLAWSALQRTGHLASDALAAGVIFVAIAALKTATVDLQSTQPLMPGPLAGLQTALVAAALFGLYHLGAGERMKAGQAGSGALLGAAAVVMASYVFQYAEGPWVSILLGVLGLAYLGTGFALAAHTMYRFVGFGVLGVVLVRVFVVDLNTTDLAVRALVFLVLGGILLGIGFVYARNNRKAAPPPP